MTNTTDTQEHEDTSQHEETPRWSADKLTNSAVGISASRRTDIPALYATWFENRLDEGFVEYIPAGPPRRIRQSLKPENITHFNFWTKWPRPFLPTLEKVLDRGYPVLWNVTITGLGGTEMEPNVPSTEKAVQAVKDLEKQVGSECIQWRYDPIVLSDELDTEHHIETFEEIAASLAGHVDRVASSFLITDYARRVEPDLTAWEKESSDQLSTPMLEERVELAGKLNDLADDHGIPFTLCCSEEVRSQVGCPQSGCNSFAWAKRANSRLEGVDLSKKPTRDGCDCSEEVDIGVYDTCVLGCRYSYGSSCQKNARQNWERHDPEHPCLKPPDE